MSDRIGIAVVTRKLALVAFAIGFCVALAPAGRAFADSETYLLLADTHLGLPNETPYGETEDALLWASSLDGIRAVAVAGDLTDRGAEYAYSEWEYLFESIMDDGVKRIQAMGDHDTGRNGLYTSVDPELTVKNGLNCFLETNGGSITSFNQFAHANIITVGGVRAKDYSVITSSMLKELDARLRKTARSGKVSIVVCHYPYNNGALNSRARLMGILRSYPNVIYVSGHMHTYSASAQCRSVTPSCSQTPYNRGGFDERVKYPFRSIGVNALSSYRSGGASYGDTLTIDNSGKITVRKWNVSSERIDRTWTFNQIKSSVSVKASASSKGRKASGKFTYQVTFSDGKKYGGVKSGSKFTLKAGKTKRFNNIPAGVLVTVKMVKGPSGWTKAKAQSVETTKSKRTIVMKSNKKSGKRLRAA